MSSLSSQACSTTTSAASPSLRDLKHELKNEKVFNGKTQEEDKTYRLSPRPCEAGPDGQNTLSLNKENDIPNDKGEDNNYIMVGPPNRRDNGIKTVTVVGESPE